jgi:hypothetical protein
MGGERWDWDEQKRETQEMYRELARDSGFPPETRIGLGLEFFPAEEDADEEALILALERFGYEVTVDPEDGTLEAAVEDVPFTLDEIWKHSERTTKIALARGYAPDGFGIWEPSDADEDEDEGDGGGNGGVGGRNGRH